MPQVTTREFAAESDVYLHLTVMQALDALEPGYRYMWARRGDESAQSAMPKNATMFFEEPPTMRSFYQQMGAADLYRLADLFSWQTGLFPIDCLFSSRAGVGPLLQLALGAGNGMFEMPVILTEPRVYGPGVRGHNTLTPTQVAIRAAGYATCFGMYWSKFEKAEALEAAKMLIAPGALEGWNRRAHVVDALVNQPKWEVTPATRPTERKRLIYMGRLNSNKRWHELLAVMASVYQSRDDVEVWVHAGTGAFDKLSPTDSRWHRTSERLPFAQYRDLMTTAHVGAYLSSDEGANVTVQEMIVSGITMVLPDRPWVRKLFDPLVYPYVARTQREMKGMIDWCLSNYGESFARLEDVRGMLRRERSWEPFVGKVGRLIEQVAAVKRPGPFRTFRTIALELMRPEGVPYSQLRQLKDDYRSGRPGFAATRNTYACYQAVRDLDDLQHADPLLRVA